MTPCTSILAELSRKDNRPTISYPGRIARKRIATMTHFNAEITLTETQRTIAGQLQENTGTHFLDSGMSNGRHWQRNAGVDLFARPDATFDHRWSGDGYLGVTISTAHYLDARLDVTRISSALTRTFRNWVDEDWTDGRRYGDDSQRYLNGSGTLLEWIEQDDRLSFHPEFTDGGYTYNDENLLSQDFVWYMFEYGGEGYTAISTHNGADARGGFSDWVIYEGGDWETFFDYGSASVYLSCDHQRSPIEQMQVDMFTGEVAGPLDPCGYMVDIRYGEVTVFSSGDYDEMGLGDLVELDKDDNDGEIHWACPCGKGSLTVDDVEGPNNY